jgi:zinc protease
MRRALAVVALAGVVGGLAACTAARLLTARPGPDPPSGSAGERLLPLDPAVAIGQLPNGLTYYLRKNAKPARRAELWLAVNAGSMQEDDDQLGLAHFVEHMAFNGTRHFAKHELVDYLERIGMRFGPDINAYTSFDETVYMIEVPTDDPDVLEQALGILEDWARGVSFEGEEIDKERGVVLEEWRLGRGAGARMRDKQFPVLFQGSRYAERLTIGKEEVLRTAPHEALRRFYRDWYRPELMALIVVGDIDPARIERRIRERFRRLASPASPRAREAYPVPDHETTLVTVATDPEATATTVTVYCKLPQRPVRTEGDLRRTLVERLHHAMLNARLDELRRAADPPFLFAYSSSGPLVRTRDAYTQGARVEEHRLVRGLEALVTEVERVGRHGFTPTELERAKKNLLRSVEQAHRERDKRESAGFAREIADHFLAGHPMLGTEAELRLVQRDLPAIALDEVNGLARSWIGEGNRVLAVQAPQKPGWAPPGEEELRAVFRRVEASAINPYEDRVREEPILADSPRPGSIVEDTRIEEIGVTRWKLSNGAQVVLKPTEFKNDEILLAGFSPGGHSLVPDEGYVSARYASAIVAAGGLGAFSAVELDKALAGKIAGASAYVGELEEGVRASASPTDAETMFQLVYLSFTAPRRDEEAFHSWRERVRGAIENRLARPETVFADRLELALAQGHFRRQPESVERLEQVDLDTALSVYRERFADAGDFTFVVVGNFAPETIRPWVVTYLGGLASTGREERERDVGVRTPDSVERVEVRRGLEPKGRVRVVFTGPAAWSREDEHDLQSLAAALRIRLREVLREDLGGTYGVDVGGGISRRPREEYVFSIGFGCDPENHETLVRRLFDEIETVKREGLDAGTVEKVREGQRRSRETNLQRNAFWLGALASHYREGLDPRLILAYDELVQRVTSERLRETARHYLDTGRYVLGVLLPERVTS